MFELILEEEYPLAAYRLLDRLEKTHQRAAAQTIYRALDFLLAHGLVYRVWQLIAYVLSKRPGEHAAVQFLVCNAAVSYRA